MPHVKTMLHTMRACAFLAILGSTVKQVGEIYFLSLLKLHYSFSFMIGPLGFKMSEIKCCNGERERRRGWREREEHMAKNIGSLLSQHCVYSTRDFWLPSIISYAFNCLHLKCLLASATWENIWYFS